MKLTSTISLGIYYGIAIYLPSNSKKFLRIGGVCRKIRQYLCKNIFLKCGDNINIERGASFGRGDKIIIGNNSAMGFNSIIPNGTIIGENILMGRDCTIIRKTHLFNRTDMPIIDQGSTEYPPLVICNDVWIGHGCYILPKCQKIGTGTIIGTGSIVTKNIPDHVIVGGNPAKTIRIRD